MSDHHYLSIYLFIIIIVITIIIIIIIIIKFNLKNQQGGATSN